MSLSPLLINVPAAVTSPLLSNIFDSNSFSSYKYRRVVSADDFQSLVKRKRRIVTREEGNDNISIFRRNDGESVKTATSELLSPTISWSSSSLAKDDNDCQKTIGTASTSTSISMNDSNRSSFSTKRTIPIYYKKEVSFHENIEIRQYAIEIGEHYSYNRNNLLPITLSWEHTDGTLMNLDTYEVKRQGLRRKGSSMKLSYAERRDMLQQIGGISEQELNKYERISLTSRSDNFSRCSVEITEPDEKNDELDGLLYSLLTSS